jgi:hypothetical protein
MECANGGLNIPDHHQRHHQQEPPANLLLSSPSKGEDTENAQLVQRFKNALRKNVEQIEAQVKVWETQIFSPELRAKMSGTEMKKKSDTVLSMHKVLPSPFILF